MAVFSATRHSSPATRHSSHPLVRLAADAIAAHLSAHRVIAPPPELFQAAPEALEPAGVFVCLKHEGQLRGCLGTIEPMEETTAMEIVRNAIGAATSDPRFSPVRIEEVEELSISIDVLGSLEPVSGPDALDPQRYGLMVRSGERRSVLLPDIESIESVTEQVEGARTKAGIGPREPVELFRFEVTRYR